MPKKREVKFVNQQSVVACPKAMSDPNKAAQLQSRTGLTIEELKEGPMRVIKTLPDKQLQIKHDRLQEAFTIHPKFVALAA